MIINNTLDMRKYLNSDRGNVVRMETYLNLEESVSTFSLLWVIEPLDAYIHGAVPCLPQTDNATDVCHVTSR